VGTDAGITRVGEGYRPNPHVVETVVARKFAEKPVGEDPLDVERLREGMVRGYTYWDQKGRSVSAAPGRVDTGRRPGGGSPSHRVASSSVR